MTRTQLIKSHYIFKICKLSPLGARKNNFSKVTTHINNEFKLEACDE